VIEVLACCGLDGDVTIPGPDIVILPNLKGDRVYRFTCPGVCGQIVYRACPDEVRGLLRSAGAAELVPLPPELAAPAIAIGRDQVEAMAALIQDTPDLYAAITGEVDR
jgi:hypothetical protein